MRWAIALCLLGYGTTPAIVDAEADAPSDAPQPTADWTSRSISRRFSRSARRQGWATPTTPSFGTSTLDDPINPPHTLAPAPIVTVPPRSIVLIER